MIEIKYVLFNFHNMQIHEFAYVPALAPVNCLHEPTQQLKVLIFYYNNGRCMLNYSLIMEVICTFARHHFYYFPAGPPTCESKAVPHRAHWKSCHCEVEVGHGIQR